MELFAIAKVADHYRIEWKSIKFASDLADVNAAKHWNQSIKKSDKKISEMIEIAFSTWDICNDHRVLLLGSGDVFPAHAKYLILRGDSKETDEGSGPDNCGKVSKRRAESFWRAINSNSQQGK